MQSDCTNAVRLHRMSDDVKGLREARVAATEARIITAARDLFVRTGYHATTLAQIAD
ncbi:TetR family transcriptional regulator, partial [Kibdelosporangium lantanae]